MLGLCQRLSLTVSLLTFPSKLSMGASERRGVWKMGEERAMLGRVQGRSIVEIGGVYYDVEDIMHKLYINQK